MPRNSPGAPDDGGDAAYHRGGVDSVWAGTGTKGAVGAKQREGAVRAKARARGAAAQAPLVPGASCFCRVRILRMPAVDGIISRRDSNKVGLVRSRNNHFQALRRVGVVGFNGD